MRIFKLTIAPPRRLWMLLLLLALPVGAATVSGCGFLWDAARTVVDIVDNAERWIGEIEQRYQIVRADLPPDVQATIEVAIARARKTAQDARGAKDTGSQAVKHLIAAYEALVGKAGVAGVYFEDDEGLLGARPDGLAVPRGSEL